MNPSEAKVKCHGALFVTLRMYWARECPHSLENISAHKEDEPSTVLL